jgi:4-amino-4-deoxy-L-arabinose transferase-like glycosyltransferase
VRQSLWVTLLVLFIYCASYAGIPHSIDELATIGVVESLLHGTLQVNRMAWEQERYPPQNALGPDGNLYSKKGLGSSLVALPFFLAGKGWAAVGAVQLAFLSTALITGLTAFTFYHLALHLGYPHHGAGLGTLALALGTLLWPYAKTLFSEPLAASGVCLALLGVTGYLRDRQSRWLLASSAGLGVVTLARPANAVLVLPFAGVLAWEWRSYLRLQTNWRRLLAAVVAFGLPLGTSVLTVCLYNYVRFRAFFSFPLVPGEGFTTPLRPQLPGCLSQNAHTPLPGGAGHSPDPRALLRPMVRLARRQSLGTAIPGTGHAGRGHALPACARLADTVQAV